MLFSELCNFSQKKFKLPKGRLCFFLIVEAVLSPKGPLCFLYIFGLQYRCGLCILINLWMQIFPPKRFLDSPMSLDQDMCQVWIKLFLTFFRFSRSSCSFDERFCPLCCGLAVLLLLQMNMKQRVSPNFSCLSKTRLVNITTSTLSEMFLVGAS